MDKEPKNNFYDLVIVMGQGALALGVLQTTLKHFDRAKISVLSLTDAAAFFCNLSSFCSKFGVKYESSSSRKEISNLLDQVIKKQASVQGSETAGFASGEVLSVPSVCDASLANRSRDAKLQNLESAKSAEGTKINRGGGQLPECQEGGLQANALRSACGGQKVKELCVPQTPLGLSFADEQSPSSSLNLNSTRSSTSSTSAFVESKLQIDSTSPKILIISANNNHLFTEEQVNACDIINFHNALLPDYKGRNAAAFAIYNAESFAGITWHVVNEAVDDGAYIVQERVALDKNTSYLQLTTKLLQLGRSCFNAFAGELFKNGLAKLLKARAVESDFDSTKPNDTGKYSTTFLQPDDPKEFAKYKIIKSSMFPNNGALKLDADLRPLLLSMDCGATGLLPPLSGKILGRAYEVASYKFLDEEAEASDEVRLIFQGIEISLKQISTFGSEINSFAVDEALSVPSVARNIKRDRSGMKSCKTLSEAKSAEGTKTDVAGGGVKAPLKENKKYFSLVESEIHSTRRGFYFSLNLEECAAFGWLGLAKHSFRRTAGLCSGVRYPRSFSEKNNAWEELVA